MPKSAIQELNGLPPKPSTKTQHWNIAMLELKKYGENIEAMREKMGLSKSSDKLHKSFKSKESKLIVSRGETQQMSGGGQHNNHLEQRGERHINGAGGTGPYSNHIPPSAAVVEVNPSGTDSGDKSSHLHENMASSEPSSPGSPRDLQIDLDNSRSPGKKRMGGGGSANVLSTIHRNIPGSLDFNEGSSPHAVGGNLSQLSRGVVKGRKAGDRLSAVLSNLTRRAGIIGGQGASVTPVNVTIGGSGASALESMDTDEPEEANGQGQSDNPFSSIYHDRNKTAIALVDPDSHKRKRNINKRFTDQQPPAKKSKVQANASSKQTSKETSSSGASTSSTEPALTITTSTSEITVNNTSLSFVNLRPEVPTAVGSSTSVSPQSSTGSPKAKGQHHAHHHHHHHHQQQPQSQLQSQLQNSASSGGGGGGGVTSGGGGGGGGGATGTPSKQNNATGKKKTKKSKQSTQNRSPTKGVSKANSSTPSRALVTTASSSSAANVSATAVTTNLTQSPSHTASASTTNGGGVSAAGASAAAGQDSLSNLRIGVRGEEAAPGIDDDDSNDFAEGSGLFADTVRKVNQSFRARVNHLTGNSDDMGYQYFTEKVSVV